MVTAKVCPTCDGKGEVPMLDGGMMPRPKGVPLPMQPCSKCDGTGTVEQ